jgi:thioredoxin-dependent peroxiredoxin
MDRDVLGWTLRLLSDVRLTWLTIEGVPVIKKLALLSLSALMLTAVVPAMAGDALTPGTSAPTFTLPSQDNTPISLSEYKGKWVVLYFYPKDMTAGCTVEAHNFQRDLEKYKAANAVVLGVSFDTTSSHQTFCTKESLSFKLLADPEGKVVGEYGVPVKNYNGMKIASRQTFLIDPTGKIVKTWPDVNQDLQGHSASVLAAIEAGGK